MEGRSIVEHSIDLCRTGEEEADEVGVEGAQRHCSPVRSEFSLLYVLFNYSFYCLLLLKVILGSL
jgi:hypothetical protein